MTKRRQTLGRDGEQQAARYLEARGYRIVARNVRAARVEMDLIARRGPLLVFVEVKSRRETGPSDFGHHGAAAEAVDERKQIRLRRGAQTWLDENPTERRRTRRLRFDVVTCILCAVDPATDRRPLPIVERTEPDRPSPRNNDTAPPERTRWSIKHWQAAF